MKKIFIFHLLVLIVFYARADKMEIECVLEHEELQLDSIPLGIIPGAGLSAVAGSSIVTVDPDMPKRSIKISVPDSLVIDGFTMCGTSLVMKIYDSIVWTSASHGFFGLTFENPGFDICQATDSTVFILRENNAMELNIVTRKPVASYRLEGRPLSMHKLNDGAVVVTDRCVASLYGGEWTILHEHPCSICCASITPHGIFFGTDDGLWRLAKNGDIELLVDGSIKALFFDCEILYMLDRETNLYRITWVTGT